MKQSPAVYPANVLADTQNRQQIATVLQSMGFETEDIQNAFTIFERSYGDRKYDISVLTEIVFQVQQNPHNEPNEHKEDAQARSAPNSPHDKPQHILHQNNISHDASAQPQQNTMLSIFNSLEMQSPPKLSHAKASSASPQILASRRTQKKTQKQTQKKKFVECLDALKKYTSEETGIIDVIFQTLDTRDPNADVFHNLANWNDLFMNMKQRRSEWNEFQTNFKLDYDESKHKRIKQKIAHHKATLKQKEKEEKETDDATLIERALQYKYDCARYTLLSCKDKLLVTANTYSILKNNKQKTELMMSKCNEKLEQLNARIVALQKEKQQYFSALERTKNKLLFQIQSIKETEISIKELHESTNKISNEMTAIRDTKECVHKMEKQLTNITQLLGKNLKQRLEPNWNEWSNRDVMIWMQHIEDERFKTDVFDEMRQQMEQSGLSGKDLPQINDFILRSSFKMSDANDRKRILKHIGRVTKLKPIDILKRKRVPVSTEPPNNICVVCTDGEANHIMIPCGHIAVCSKCVNKCKKYRKCPFCAKKTTNIIKCFHVGF